MQPDPLFPTRNNRALHLWCAYPNDILEAPAAAACAALLSQDERGRWQRFLFEANRREFLATHALARTALSHYRPVAPQAWRFQVNDYGKPAIEPDCGLRFNLSNSPGLVVCLVAEGAEVGVDVEPVSRADKIAEVAHKVFSAAERAQLQALPAAERLDRGVSLWTLKESYIKGRGMGLSLPLEKISFLFDAAGGARMVLDPALGDEPGRWRFRQVDYAGHRIAVMADAPIEHPLEIWEVRLPLSAPMRVLAEKAGG